MTSEVGVDDANHLDMASSIGTYTTHSSTCDESRRSDKENAQRQGVTCAGREPMSRVELVKGDKGHYKVVTLQDGETNSDDESSVLSADFEDNDFDALVGEFFWYLRDKESGKMTPSRQSKRLSISTPDRTPRAMGGSGRILTPRNSEKGDHSLDANKQRDRNNSSLLFDNVDATKDVDIQKENVTRDSSVLLGDAEVEDAGETAPVPSTSVHFEHDESMHQDTNLDEAILTHTTIMLNDTEVEASSIDEVVLENLGIKTGSPTRAAPKDYDRSETEVNLHENSSPSAVMKESREDNNTRSEHQMTPSRDDSWNAVWTRKGLMGRTPTPLKKMSSRIDGNSGEIEDGVMVDNTAGWNMPASSEETVPVFASPGRKVMTWPPVRTADSCPPFSSPARKPGSDTDTSQELLGNTSGEDVEFDADMQLSRILDEADPQTRVLEDMSDADMELSRILDDSPGVNTILNATRDFLESHKHILEVDNTDSSQARLSEKPILDLRSPLSHTDGNRSSLSMPTSTLESNDAIGDAKKKTEDGRDPDSVLVISTSNSVVAETSSLVFDSLSPNSVRGRETPSNFVSHNITTERCVDPDGYLMDDESSCLTPPSLAPTPTNEAEAAHCSISSVLKPESVAERSGNLTPALSQNTENESDANLSPSASQGTQTTERETEIPQRFPMICTLSPKSTTSNESSGGETSLGVKDGNSALALQQLNSTLESRLSFDSPPPEESPMRKSRFSLGSPSSESVSSRKTYGSFAALSISAIEKKPNSSPHSSQSTLFFKTSLVFDSPPEEEAAKQLSTSPKLDNTSLQSFPESSESSIHIGSLLPSRQPFSKANGTSPRSASSSESSFSLAVKPTESSLPIDTSSMLPSNQSISKVDDASPGSAICSESSFSSAVPSPENVVVKEPITASSMMLPAQAADEGSAVHDISSTQDDASPRSTGSSESNLSFAVSSSKSNAVEVPKTASSRIPPPQTAEASTVPDSSFIHESSEEQSSSGSASPSHSMAGSKQASPRVVALSTSESKSPLKVSSTMINSPPDHVSEPSTAMATPPPKPMSVRKPSNKFASILNQWKEKSEHNPNGHFLSPPANDTAPYYPTPPRASRTPVRRKSTGQQTPPKWTPSRTTARRDTIDISSITIPNKSLSSRKQTRDSSTKTTQSSSADYWNGMIQKDNDSSNKWASRSFTLRESSEPVNLMLTVPKQDSSSSLPKDTTLTSSVSNDDDVPCTCHESAFSGNDQLMEFFLPKLGMAHTCGKRNPPILIDSDPIGLHHILRPWQVDFLRSCDIYRGDQLVKACKKRAGTLAGAMRKWRLDHGMTCPRSVSCGMALHIWSRTCKYYVRTIRRQMADGMVEVEPPTLGDVMTTCVDKEKAVDSSFVSSSSGDEEHGESKDYM